VSLPANAGAAARSAALTAAESFNDALSRGLMTFFMVSPD
jgi:hypothetical protein